MTGPDGRAGPRPRRGRVRRQRTVTESLAGIVLATEVLVVALASLALFGLRSLPPVVALGGGGALVLLAVIAAGLAGKRIGIVLGWIVQVVLVASIVVNVAVGIVGILFAALWAYSMVRGARLDRGAA